MVRPIPTALRSSGVFLTSERGENARGLSVHIQPEKEIKRERETDRETHTQTQRETDRERAECEKSQRMCRSRRLPGREGWMRSSSLHVSRYPD